MKIGNIELEGNLFLAPMAGVTDSAFRRICKRYGASFVYSEMISAKALYYKDQKTHGLLVIDDEERPCGVQIFGSEPDLMASIAQISLSTGAALIDINMGCPVPKIVNNCEGRALMKNPKLVGEIVYRVSNSVDVPVTVKIRKGWDEDNVNAVEIAKIACENGAAAITVHGRTRDQFYSGKADWDIIARVKEAVDVPVIGNGDIFYAEDATRMLAYTGCDGVMVARGAQGNPFIFNQIKSLLWGGNSTKEVSTEERIDVLLEQIHMMIEQKGEYIAIREARKHVAWYIKGMQNSAKARHAINTTEDYDDMKKVLQSLV